MQWQGEVCGAVVVSVMHPDCDAKPRHPDLTWQSGAPQCAALGTGGCHGGLLPCKTPSGICSYAFSVEPVNVVLE